MDAPVQGGPGGRPILHPPPAIDTPDASHGAAPEALRDELSPLAEGLVDSAAELAAAAEGRPGLPEDSQARRDVVALERQARAFREGLPRWFPGGGSPGEEAFRDARHDARNALNRLFGLAHLLRLDEGAAGALPGLPAVSESLERCLAALNRPVPGGVSAEDSVVEPRAPAAAVGDARLLIADDEAENREILERMLAPLGFEVHFAVNGCEALERLEEINFDAVLLDIQMPEMDGFEVLARMRESGALRHTPVIVVTGLQEEQDAVRCIEIGAEDFLSRPIRPALLMARLNASLEKKRLREKVLEQHFTPELARELARNPDPMKMQARQAEVTVLFCDIRGFSAISERLGPTQTVDWLSGVMGEFSSAVIDRGGVLVDYTGDELLAMWGAPKEQPDHAELACRAALDMLARLPALNERWGSVVNAETEVGIGVNTGEALVGNIGTHIKFKYGPLGTTVNLASRVQGATRFLKTPLLITGDTAAQLPGGMPRRRLCRVRVQNIRAPIDLYELLPGEGAAEGAGRYEEALEAFEAGEFAEAARVLGEVLDARPEDGPGLQLMSRIARARIEEGGEDAEFSPVWNLPGK